MSEKPRFRQGDSVILRSSLDEGTVLSDPVLDGEEYWYRVRFTKRVVNVVEDDLDAFSELHDSIESLVTTGQWGRIQAFRTALAVERIANENRSTVYSFRSQRVLFEPHQYKPLLKLLDSLDRRLLIADEVGLGKTIEAGLILAEIEARRPVERVLVACPSRLRDKWREEMNRKFDQPFDVLDRRGFEQYVVALRQSQRRRQLRAIMSMQSLRSQQTRALLTGELGQLDLVVVDEAHHARNPATQTSALLRDLCEISECVILLTATPLHLGSEDLFTLLSSLRPTEFRDAAVFDQDLRHHAPVFEAARLLRTQDRKNLVLAKEYLERVFINGVLEPARNPLAAQVIEDMQHDPPSDRREWIELERRVQDLHPLSSIVTRTRKRDVQEHAPTRRPYTFRCRWTKAEDHTYQRLVAGSSQLGWIREKLTLGQIQRARQAASCLPATMEAGSIAGTSDDECVESTDILPSEVAADVGADEQLQSTMRDSGTLPDSKFDQLYEILLQIWKEEPSAKILVFTFFVGTAKYLERRLSAEGVQCLRIAGDVPSNPLDPGRDERGHRIQQFRDDKRMRVLVSTEVGSEGLDFQFCHHLVNYDLPWNPMVVEQRIGRIDRFGQQSPIVNIHNLVVEGTIEDRILHRLYERINIFKHSIGDLEAILGETMNELRSDYISGRLTPEEAEQRVEHAARAVQQRQLHLERLEKSTAELFGHEEYIRDEMARIGRLGRFVSEEAMLAVIKTYLEAHHPQVRVWQDAEGVYACQLTESLRQSMQDAVRGGPAWLFRKQGDSMRFTMRGDIAFDLPEIELVNVSHPLIRAAVDALKKQLGGATARVGQATLELSSNSDLEIPVGVVFLVVYVLVIDGLRPRRLFETIAWSDARNEQLDQETAERLLHLVLDRGANWNSSLAAPAMPVDIWELVASEMRRRNRRLDERENRENEASYLRRKSVLQAEYEYNRRSKEQRLQTAIARGSEKVVPALRGQLQKAKSEYRAKLAELDNMRMVSVTHPDPLAACVVEVLRKQA
ncbi:MAG: DEAD/DEAH box helicase [Pirellulales bacterium]|nr:DEAD/DEAH box helicase [Pirellulales bacterium]